MDEAIDEDLEALAREVEKLVPGAKDSGEKRQPKRQALPAHLPRREVRHEPETTMCSCGCELKRVGEDVAEKLDYTPGTFTVERHVRGKWACTKCQTLVQAAVPAHVIDKGLATAGLMAHVTVAKFW
ncbi:transposase [Variovorax paradoxus]|nr:transposase [Variovorax paradoxus]